MKSVVLEEEWKTIEAFLPARWQWQAKKTGSVERMRGVRGYGNLLRLLMLHVSGGLSLAQAVVRAKELGIADITPMALHKRLCGAAGWLEWLCAQLLAQREPGGFAHGLLAGRRVLAVDGSDITEPGSTGCGWHLHYAIELPQLRCVHAEFDAHEKGESLERFPIEKGDVVMADRGYARRSQLDWLIERGADAIVRVSPNHFPVENADETKPWKASEWLKRLRKLKGRKPGEWTVRFTHEGRTREVRLCAMRKGKPAAQKAVIAIEREARKKNREVRPETLEYARYVLVITTLPKTLLSAGQVLETYRSRWQVELAFKRLKSLLECRCVPKSDQRTARAWMQGKLLEALLVEKLLLEAECFPPCGGGC